MNLLCIGVNHRVATVDVRERLAVSSHKMPEVLADLTGNVAAVVEAVILSTCNRVEFYVASTQPTLSLEDFRSWTSGRTGIDPPFYCLNTSEAIRHLFKVAAGLDSMVLGESEVFGQVKKAYRIAFDAGATSRYLNKFFQQAFRVAKQVRTETQIAAGATSVGSVAVDLAQKIFGDLSRRHVMILGAGETSELTARYLQSHGIQSVFVSNRSFERASRLAKEIGGRAIQFDNWQEAFHEVDILITATSAPHAILTTEKLLPMMQERPDQPLFIIDLAVPRDADPSISKLKGIHLFDIDSLQEIADQGMVVRRQEISCCESIISKSAQNFEHWFESQNNRDTEMVPQKESVAG
ncbi:MAG: glutamyl-tRNA reductase [Chthoniobacterales bacterium]